MSKVPWDSLYTNNCPPNSAQDGNVNPVYRLVRNRNKIDVNDFAPHQWLNLGNISNINCSACATSVFESLKHITDLRNMPNMQKKSLVYIAEGCINSGEGKIEYGINTHINWWITIPDPHKNFRILP